MRALKILPVIGLLIATAFTQAVAKPADRYNDVARTFLKPGKTLVRSSRPTRDYHYLSPGGHFLIHYDNSGSNAVPQDFTYNDSIPDFVYKAAEYLDASFNILHDSLGFKVPPTDNLESPEIDIYFRYDLMYYGLTYPEDQATSGTSTAYLYLSTQLNDSTVFYTSGLEGLRVTCAHELFHIFQLGYMYRDKDVFYFEMSSVWFEEYMYPEVNDYHAYVNEYARNWKYAINSSILNYNNAGFNLYIDRRFSSPGDNIIHSIWNRIINTSALNAIRDELDSRSSSFEEAMAGWGTAQVLCGDFVSDNFLYPFQDASELQTISFDRYTDNILAGTTGSFSFETTPMTTYYKLTGIPSELLLFEALFSDGTEANLICLNGSSSKVIRIDSDRVLINGQDYNQYILAVGTDAESTTGTYAFSALTENKVASIYPNPVLSGQKITMIYVLLEDYPTGTLAIFDINGRKIMSHALSSSLLSQGMHELQFTPLESSSGIYIIAMYLDDRVIAKKFTYLK